MASPGWLFAVAAVAVGATGCSSGAACASPEPICRTGILCGDTATGEACFDTNIGVHCPGVPGRAVAGDCATGVPLCVDIETSEVVAGTPFCDECPSNICVNDMR
jgi:hypothetical protein